MERVGVGGVARFGAHGVGRCGVAAEDGASEVLGGGEPGGGLTGLVYGVGVYL